MPEIDIYYNSNAGAKEFQIASGHISETRILFENERIIVLVHAEGSAEFYSAAGTPLAKGSVAAEEGGREKYEDVRCDVCDKMISIGFADYEWIDNYPNCDGEYDRWDKRIIGYRTLKFSAADNSVTAE